MPQVIWHWSLSLVIPLLATYICVADGAGSSDLQHRILIREPMTIWIGAVLKVFHERSGFGSSYRLQVGAASKIFTP